VEIAAASAAQVAPAAATIIDDLLWVFHFEAKIRQPYINTKRPRATEKPAGRANT
jgi:hypothetical protein